MISLLKTIFAPKCNLCESKSPPLRKIGLTITGDSTARSTMTLCDSCAPVCNECGGIRLTDRLVKTGIMADVDYLFQQKKQKPSQYDAKSLEAMGLITSTPARKWEVRVLEKPFCRCKPGNCALCHHTQVTVRPYPWHCSGGGLHASGITNICLSCAELCCSCGGAKITQTVFDGLAKRNISIRKCECT